jgi:hypothetical protein
MDSSFSSLPPSQLLDADELLSLPGPTTRTRTRRTPSNLQRCHLDESVNEDVHLDNLYDELEEIFPLILTTSGSRSVTCGETGADVTDETEVDRRKAWRELVFTRAFLTRASIDSILDRACEKKRSYSGIS